MFDPEPGKELKFVGKAIRGGKRAGGIKQRESQGLDANKGAPNSTIRGRAEKNINKMENCLSIIRRKDRDIYCDGELLMTQVQQNNRVY